MAAQSHWIPACAGMTHDRAGTTHDCTAVTNPSSRLREAQTGTQVSSPQPVSPLQNRAPAPAEPTACESPRRPADRNLHRIGRQVGQLTDGPAGSRIGK
jgi:hypothetical protein